MRKRPLSPRARKALRVLRNIHIAVFVVAVIVPAGIEFASQRGLREIKRQMRAEGLPLTPGELNRPLPPADRNAAPLYVRLTELLDKQPLTGDDKVLDDVTKQVPPTPDHIARLRFALQRRQDVVSLIHQAAQRPECVFSRNYALGPNLLFPEYARMRSSARILTNESLVMLADGKTIDAIRNESLGFRVAQQAAAEPNIIGKLVGVALNTITLRFMERVLYTAGDQPGIAQSVADTIAQNWKTVSMADGMRGEIILGEVVFGMLRNGKTLDSGKEGLLMGREVRPAPNILARAMLDANELYLLTCQRENLHLMARSYQAGKADMSRLEREAQAYPWLPTRTFASILLPMFMQARTKQAQGEAQAAVVRTAALAFAYRQQHGSFEDERALDHAPTGNDPFGISDVAYRGNTKSFYVFSAGPTGDFMGGSADRRPDSIETVFRYPMPAYYTQKSPPASAAPSAKP